MSFLAHLELDLERRLALELEDKVVGAPRGEVVVDAEAVLGSLLERRVGEREDVLLEADEPVAAAGGSDEAGSLGSGVEGVTDAAEEVGVVSSSGGEEGQVGTRLDRGERPREGFAGPRALGEGVGRVEGRFP